MTILRNIVAAALCSWLVFTSPAAQAQGDGPEDIMTPVPATAPSVRAAPRRATPEPAAPRKGDAQLPIDVQADRIEYRNNNKTMDCIGNAVVTQGDSVFKADLISIDTETYEAHATGNIHIVHEGRVHTGEEFTYNFKTGEGDFGSFNVREHPYTMNAEAIQRVGDGAFLAKNAHLTTCESDKPEFYIRARDVEVVPDERIKARHVVMYYRGVPVFYLPFVSQSLDSSESNLDVVPGYSDRMGAYLLTAYGYRLNQYLKGVTRLDFRQKRGVAVGQDLYWRDPVQNRWDGEFRVYYLNDQEPYRDAEDEEQTSDLVDSDRYRLKLRHQQSLTSADTLRIRSDYLSDPDVLEDFYDNEFRHNTQPENFVVLTHRDRKYTAAVNVNSRVNDFYANVNRLPEATFEAPSLQLGDTDFYYETRNSAGYLERVFAEQDGDAPEDYDAGRIDTDHRLSYYTKQFGFLNLIPRLGYAATYYSTTIDTVTTTNTTTTVDEATGELVDTETVTTSVFEEGADLRNYFELGLATSFKAFKVIHERPGRGNDVGLRHVVEPRMDYTYRPEPNVTPDQLYRFDGIDLRDELHTVQLGLRNKLQTKRRGRAQDLIDFDLFTFYRIAKDAGQEDFTDIFFDTELRLVDSVLIDFDGAFNTYESEFSRFNTQVALIAPGRSSMALEYRYRPDARDLLSGDLRLFPGRKVSYAGYARYDFLDGDLEEHSHLLALKSDCVGWGLGFRETGDEVQIWLQVWLTALPRGIVELGR